MKSLAVEIHHFVSHSCAQSVQTPSSKCNFFRLAVFYSWVFLSAPLSIRGTSALAGCVVCGTIKKEVIGHYTVVLKNTFSAESYVVYDT